MNNGARATDDFVSFILSLQAIDPLSILSVFFLTIARILPIMTIVPFLGAKNMPAMVRMMFSVALCALFLPQNLLSIQSTIPYGMGFIGLMLKEIAIGAFLGFIAAVPFYIAQSTGTLIDHSRGSSALQVTDPTTQSQTGPIGILYNYILIAIFFAIDGPFLFFNALARSYQLIPVDHVFTSAFFNLRLPFWKEMIVMLQHIMVLTIQLSSPALIAMLLTDLFLGIANRMAPQVQVVFLGIPLKSWVGIALLAAAWPLIISVMSKESGLWMKSLLHYIEQTESFSRTI